MVPSKVATPYCFPTSNEGVPAAFLSHQHLVFVIVPNFGHSDRCVGIPCGTSEKERACNAGDIRDSGWIPGSGRSPGEGNGTHSSILA